VIIEWLSAHGAPRTAEFLARLQRDGWTIRTPDPEALTQTELWVTAPFADIEHARSAARAYHDRAIDVMHWAPRGEER
jgi:hypothetical protein